MHVKPLLLCRFTISVLIVDDIKPLMQKYFNASASLSFAASPNISDSDFPSIGLDVPGEQLMGTAFTCIKSLNSIIISIMMLNSTKAG